MMQTWGQAVAALKGPRASLVRKTFGTRSLGYSGHGVGEEGTGDGGLSQVLSLLRCWLLQSSRRCRDND